MWIFLIVPTVIDWIIGKKGRTKIANGFNCLIFKHPQTRIPSCLLMRAFSTPVDEMRSTRPGSSDPVREALHWSETHSSSYLSDAQVAVGIQKNQNQKILGSTPPALGNLIKCPVKISYDSLNPNCKFIIKMRHNRVEHGMPSSSASHRLIQLCLTPY